MMTRSEPGWTSSSPRARRIMVFKVPQRHSLNVFQEDGRSGPLADLMSHLGGRAEDGHLAEEARDAGVLEGPKALVCVDFVLVAVGSLGVPLLENDARRQELLW